jgi:DNA-binding PadR family transcriptional regulator
LTNAENTGKPWISYYKITPDGKVEIHDIKITKIDSKIGGEYLEDSQEASAMTYNAFGVHPNLVGVIPSKSSSNLSGSDKRELLRIAQTLQVMRRQKKLELLKLVKEINKWPSSLVLYIQDVILTTLDQGKEVQSIDTPAK